LRMGILDILFQTNFSVFESSRDFFTRRGLPLEALAQTTSTNDRAKSEAFSISEPLKVYLVDQQSQGRGRGENGWSMPLSGQVLMVIFSLRVTGAPQAISGPLAGLAVYEAATKIWPHAEAAFKAPYDIVVREKKLGGLLVEATQMGTQHRL